MKPFFVPMICGTALAAMSAAGFSHWWSVRQFVIAINTKPPFSAPLRHSNSNQPSTPTTAAPLLTLTPANPTSTPATDAAQKKFYEALVAKMESLQNQNRDLLDQVAETNRDLMKLEFRVDTHSESFRPMPINQDRPDTSFDSGPGVLPPRAEPVPDYP